jgi:hypothetical protein
MLGVVNQRPFGVLTQGRGEPRRDGRDIFASQPRSLDEIKSFLQKRRGLAGTALIKQEKRFGLQQFGA